jgi:3-oxoacyl-[acyl-carrier protein] reductase
MNKKLIALATLLPCVALTGCVATAPPPNPSFVTVAPAAPTPTPSSTAVPAADGIVDTVYVQVFPGRIFKAKHGCRCTLPDSTQELFPAGTPVVFMKLTMTGEWKPSQGKQTYQVVTGTTLKGTQFDGRPEPAVLDTVDGPSAAKAAGLPWLPTGLFGTKTDWTIPNDKDRSFAAAWYLPAGVDRLLLTVDVPSEGQPLHLIVPLRSAAASGE